MSGSSPETLELLVGRLGDDDPHNKLQDELMQQYKTGDLIGGEYTVLKVFGGEKQSGMGVVYLVQNREIPKPIVLKTFQQKLSSDTKRQFLSEAHAWISAGAHINIVQAFWVREIAEQMFVAAEYVEPDEDGRNNLTDYLNTGSLLPEVVLMWAAQFCYGMDYARSRGVLAHRDIKPDNLMIDRTATLKITDFGLAKSIEINENPQKQGWWPFAKKQEVRTVSQTKTGSAMGTLPYMAPEQFVDAKSTDHRADIYSFGIILYQMMTGNGYPYRINSNAPDIGAEFYKAHTSQKPITVESPLMPIIFRCLEKRPEHRYASYDAFLADIGAVAKKLQIKLPRVVHVSKEDEELYAQAQSYVALGDKDRALMAINKYVSRYGENECGWTEKGRIHFERGEYQAGLEATRRSLDLNPYNTHAWNNFGILLYRTEAPGVEVKKAYANALRLDPYNTATMMNLVGPLVLRKEYAEAAALAAKALRLRPEKPLVMAKIQELLREFMEARDFYAAKTLLEGWTEARPQDVDAWHNLGLIFLEQQLLEKAIHCFKQVHRLTPKDGFALAQLAKLTFQAKKARECLGYCNELLQQGHEPLLAVSLKARVLNFVGGYEQSIRFIQPYIDHNPNSDALLVVLAEIHEYRDNISTAIAALQKAKHILERGDKCNEDSLQFVNMKIKQLSTMKH
jgi:serine/threonine protein kinase/cytochrome c-type biogenesis protein CcmH/NrfG